VDFRAHPSGPHAPSTTTSGTSGWMPSTWSTCASVAFRRRTRARSRNNLRPWPLQRQGLIRQLGLSNVTSGQLKQANSIAKVVCVQNHDNIVHRDDGALIDELGASGVAYVPFFPLGGFTPLQSSTLSEVARRVGATRMALAWLLHRAPNILLIPGTSSIRPPA
jgi:hypothetical protein